MSAGNSMPSPDRVPPAREPEAKKRKRLKIVGLGCGIPFGLFMLLGVIGSLTGPPKTANATHASPTPKVPVPAASAAAPSTAPAAPNTPAPSAAATSPTSNPSPDPKPSTAQPSAAASPGTAAQAAAGAPQATPAPASPTTPTTTGCTPTRDIIVRFVVPGLPPSSELLGDVAVATCEPTFQSLEKTSPKNPGYCTEAAWASDNPGYQDDVTPAPPLKKVQVAYGPACT